MICKYKEIIHLPVRNGENCGQDSWGSTLKVEVNLILVHIASVSFSFHMAFGSCGYSINIVPRLWVGWPSFKYQQGEGRDFFWSPPYHDQLSGPPSLLSGGGGGTGGSFPRAKAARTCSWPLTSIKCWGWECMNLYLHFPYILLMWHLIKHRICLHSNFTF